MRGFAWAQTKIPVRSGTVAIGQFIVIRIDAPGDGVGGLVQKVEAARSIGIGRVNNRWIEQKLGFIGLRLRVRRKTPQADKYHDYERKPHSFVITLE